MDKIRILIAAAILAVVGIAGTAQSQRMPLLGVGAPPAAAPAGYTGPGDIVSGATAWYGVRAYSAATRGANAVEVCNTTGAVEVACVNYVTDATTGDLVIATIGGLTCAALGTNCTVKTFYDQTAGGNCGGTCNMSNATLTARPQLVPSCINGKPCLACTTAASKQLNTTGNLGTVAQPFTISETSIRTTGTTLSDVFNFGGIEVYYASGGNLKGMYAGTVQTVAATDNNWYATQYLFSGASSVMYINGSSNSTSPGTTSATGDRVRICGLNVIDGNVAEGGIWPSAFSAGNQSSMNSNQRAYYGF